MSVFIPAGSGILTTAWAGSATSEMTIMARISFDVTTPSASGWRDIVVIEPNIYLQTFSDGVTSDFGSANFDHVGPILAINTWYHLAMVVVPTSTTNRQHYGYINGKLVVNAVDASTFTAHTAISIGNTTSFGLTYAFNGQIRDVRVWNRALTATNIVDEMRSSIPVRKESLLLWAPLSDSLTIDCSGNGRILTASGTPAPALQGGEFGISRLKKSTPF